MPDNIAAKLQRVKSRSYYAVCRVWWIQIQGPSLFAFVHPKFEALGRAYAVRSRTSKSISIKLLLLSNSTVGPAYWVCW